MSGANISVREAATASSQGRNRQKFTYASTAKRTPGRRKRWPTRSSRFTPIASPRRSHASMPPSSPGRPSWSMMRWIQCWRTSRSGQLDRIRASYGDADLIIEAVRHPQLQLLARELAAVHPLVEGVEVVVAALQHGAQPADQLLHRMRGQLHAHSSNSIASSPTTMEFEL